MADGNLGEADVPGQFRDRALMGRVAIAVQEQDRYRMNAARERVAQTR